MIAPETVGTPVQDTNKIQDRIKDRRMQFRWMKRVILKTNTEQYTPVTKNPQDDIGSQTDKNKNGRDSWGPRHDARICNAEFQINTVAWRRRVKETHVIFIPPHKK